jgi:hypothetical protein
MEFYKVDRKCLEIINALKNASIFQKKGFVEARPATIGEQIVTTLAGGIEETTCIACKDDCVIKNPSGEQYIISQKKFLDRYEVTDNAGIYQKSV